ncbi:keratin, type II cytoskeletal 8-like isoform X1 [Anarrhichthys ocellatus]|uniref:keratin, type II cytoskeletal 8-like isoform X1 n=1 Tax=Anarrhichthys ocellatus TaxID=433405 RepID=UPI0012ECE4AA|nr:keratin, type II cytoskeletal 8-like isoform X1 [Anarrhichthys ocellatus]
MSKPRDYSSQSYSPGIKGPVKSSSTDNKIDPSVKSREKDAMVGLNDKFIQLIDKVKNLEDENKMLDKKRNILKDQGDYEGKVDDIVKQLQNEMEQQIEKLLNDQEKLQAELLQNQEEVDHNKKRYEEEFVKKAELENEFVIKKKDVDGGQLETVDLVLELEDLMGKLDFLRVGYDEEIKELESLVQNKTVVLHDDSKRSLDMDKIIEGVKNQYANMAAHTREEAEHWNQKKMDAMVLPAGQREKDVRDLKRDISDLVRHTQRINGDLEALQRKEESLKKDIIDMRTEGDNNLERAREDIAQLEEALRRTKQDLAGQIHQHQKLINLKLALDIEIATYRKLLEGEEQRIYHLMRNGDVHLPLKQHLLEKPRAQEPAVVPAGTLIPAVYPASKKRLLIRVEVEEGRVVSESSHYAED